jgi:Domain of unknown function (DUF4062)/NB-ARC domain
VARIYVSSTYSDLRLHRERVRSALRKLGHVDIAMEHYPSEGRPPLDKCHEDVAGCDLFLGILAFRYGYIPPGENRSVTELEYRKALDTGKPCLFFLLKEDASWPINQIEFTALEKIKALRKEVQEKFLISFFTDADDLEARVLEALARWQQNAAGQATLRALRRPFQAPPLPSFYVERSAADQELAELLLQPASQNGVLVVGALHGLGGVGKTSLAAALAHNPAVQKRFKDGVLWATLGQNPDCLSLLSGWIRSLGDLEYRPTTVPAASAYLRTLLESASTLLVVDDIWESGHAKPFLVGGPQCCLLLTTRRAHIADELGARLWALDVMSPHEAVDLLRKRIETRRRGAPLSRSEMESAATLAEMAGYLPLALELLGALIARGYGWDEACQSLRLGEVEEEPSRHRAHSRLIATLQLSLEYLRREDPAAWECFVWLGVLPQKPLLNSRMAATLWSLSESRAQELLNMLSDDAILQRRTDGFTLHDFMHEMAQKLLSLPAPQGLGLISRQAHRKLLDRYQTRLAGKSWGELEDDGYIHAWLVWHLQQSGDPEAVEKLFSLSAADGRHAWYTARDQIGQPAGFLDDLHAVWQGERERVEFRLATQCRYALMVSSLHSLAQAIPPELALVLLKSGVWTPEQALDRLRQLRNPAERARSLVGLVGLLGEEGYRNSQSLHEAAAKEARDAVLSGLPNTSGAEILIDLAGQSTGENQIEILVDAVSLVTDFRAFPRIVGKLPMATKDPLAGFVRERLRQMGMSRKEVSRVIGSWGDSVPSASLPEGIAAAHELKKILAGGHGSDLEDAIQLIPRLDPPREEYVRALLAAYNWMGSEAVGELLTRLSPSLPAPARTRLAEELIGGGKASVGARCVLAEIVPEPRRGELLQTAIQDLTLLPRYTARQAMTAIARSCAPAIVRRALRLFQQIDDERELFGLVMVLIPHSAEVPQGEIFDSIPRSDKQLKLLMSMTAELSQAIKGGLLDDFVVEAARFSSEWWIVEALTMTLLRLTEPPQIEAVLRATALITASDLRARLIGRIALRLALLGFPEEAIRAASEAPSPLDRWRILSDTAADLAARDLFTSARALANRIEDEEEQSKALSAIALHLAARGHLSEARHAAIGIRAEAWLEMVQGRLNSLQGDAVAPAAQSDRLRIDITTDLTVDFDRFRALREDLLRQSDDSRPFADILAAARNDDLAAMHQAATGFWQARAWSEKTFLESIAGQPRPIFLKELRKVSALLTLALEPDEIADLVRSLRDVARWWP